MLRQKTVQPYSYNEVVLDTAAWVKALPYTLEAIFFYKGNDDGTARALHRRFADAFPHASTPLLSLDMSNAQRPFALAQ